MTVTELAPYRSRPRRRPASVVFVCLESDTLGGVQRVTQTLAQGLAGRGYGALVVGLHRAAEPVRYEERPAYRHVVVSPRPVGGEGWMARRRADRRLRRLLDSQAPGFLVLTSPSVVARLSATFPPGQTLPGMHRIGQYHGSFEHACGSWHLASIRRHYGRLDQAVFLSEDDAWRFSEHALLPNAVALPDPLPGWPAPGETSPLAVPRLLGVGRLTGVKRFDRLISAFAGASRTVAERWELHLIGDGEEAGPLAAHARALGVADRVVFRGRVPADRMGPEYRAAALLGLSSEHEGFSLAIAEAAAYGMPTVAFDVSGGVRSLVADGVTGLLVPPGDVDGFAAALARSMTDQTERRRLGAAARAHVHPLRLDAVLDRWEALFHHVNR